MHVFLTFPFAPQVTCVTLSPSLSRLTVGMDSCMTVNLRNMAVHASSWYTVTVVSLYACMHHFWTNNLYRTALVAITLRFHDTA